MSDTEDQVKKTRKTRTVVPADPVALADYHVKKAIAALSDTDRKRVLASAASFFGVA